MNNCNSNISVNETFIVSSTPIIPVVSCITVTTDYIYSCDDILMVDFSANTINPHVDIVPNSDNELSLGTPSFRFREINTYSGTSTYWVSTNSVTTPNLDLGLDSLNNSRIITADNSIIENDILNGGQF